MTSPLLSRLKASVALTAIVAQLAVAAGPASAFCGFYVAQVDAKLFNKSSKVVLTRNGQPATEQEREPTMHTAGNRRRVPQMLCGARNRCNGDQTPTPTMIATKGRP